MASSPEENDAIDPDDPPDCVSSVYHSLPYPFPPDSPPPSSSSSRAHPHKRRQVKNACTNCQKACKKCDDARPCLRCVKYGIAEECMDSQRKERKRGIKRGPYKKRDIKGSHPDQPPARTVPAASTDGTQSPPSVGFLSHHEAYSPFSPRPMSKSVDHDPRCPTTSHQPGSHDPHNFYTFPIYTDYFMTRAEVIGYDDESIIQTDTGGGPLDFNVYRIGT